MALLAITEKNRIISRIRMPIIVVGLLAAPFVAGLAAYGEPAWAQGAPDAAARQYQIPAGSLASALNRFALETGIDMVYDPSLVQGRQTSGLQGAHSVASGFSVLLQGTGLLAEAQGGGRYRLRAAGAVPAADGGGGVHTLSSIRVKADTPAQESASNYTVRRSSSASKLDLELKETPQSITVFTEKLVADLNATTVDQVLAYAPGVTVVENGVPGAGRVQYFARGFAINSFQIDGVMVDGAAFGALNNQSNRTAVGFQDAFMYERMDVIRGSTGLTSGQGDPSASLNFVRKKPLPEQQFLVNLKYGSWNNRRAEVDVSTPINASKSWRMRVVGTANRSDAHLDRVSSKGHAYHVMTELDVTPQTRVSAGITETHRRLDGAGPHGMVRTCFLAGHQVCDTGAGRSFNNATNWSYRDFNYRNVFASVEHLFANDWSIAAHYNRFTARSDRMYGVLGTVFLDPTRDVGSYVWGREKYENKNTSYDIHLKGHFGLLDRQHDFVIGYNQNKSDRGSYDRFQSNPSYPTPGADLSNPRFDPRWDFEWLHLSEWNDGDVPFPRTVRFPAAGTTPPTLDQLSTDFVHTQNNQKGFYASTRLRPLEHLQVILGARYGKGERKYNQPTTFSPYAGLIYELTPAVNAYVGLARVERPNADVGMNYPVTIDGEFLEPIRADTIEAGFKAGFFDNRLNVAATYFTMTQDNFPTLTDKWVVAPEEYGGGIQQAWEGVDGYRIYGVELSVAGQITPNWQVLAGWVHQRQKTPAVIQPADGGGADDDDFTAQFFFPKNSFKLFTTYDFGSNRQYTLGGGLTWQSAGRTAMQYVLADGERAYWWQGSYAVYNLMARWRINKHATLGVNVNNVFDKEYFSSSSRGNYGLPRSFMASLSLQF